MSGTSKIRNRVVALAPALTLFAGAVSAGIATAAETAVVVSDEVLVTASRLDDGSVVGASTTVIDAEEIEASPARTLPDLLNLQAGVQVRELYGSSAGSRASIDIRGFGATGTQNALILVNGRRLNDFDLASIDLAAIPKDSIERVEVTRGNSAAVLYGDGAVGGVVNIITKGAGAGQGFTGSVDYSYGSFDYHEGNIHLGYSDERWGVVAYGNVIDTQGYRKNNELDEKSVVFDVRYRGDGADYYVNFTADDQDLGLPGPRAVNPGMGIDQPRTDPRGATTPFDEAEQTGFSATVGSTIDLGEGAELVVDGGVRRKEQLAQFISAFGTAFNSAVETELTTGSFTPRLTLEHELFGLPADSRLGVDFYYSDYLSDRPLNRDTAPPHEYQGYQATASLYGQTTVALTDSTDVALGFRGQWVEYELSDTFDITAPGASMFDSQQPTGEDSEFVYAAHLGLEQFLTDTFSLFGRIGKSYRLPTIDERVRPFTGAPLGTLQTQHSRDIEGGFRYQGTGFSFQTSGYAMELEDEIFFNPVTFENINLDPTLRYGWEASATARPLDVLTLNAAVALTRAIFTEGPNDGNDVPLVAPWTASATALLDVNALLGTPLDSLTFATTVSYVGERHRDNDGANFQPEIDPYTLVDLKLAGSLGPVEAAVTVSNVFDENYVTYGAASATTFGVYNDYTLPGRTFLVTVGAKF